MPTLQESVFAFIDDFKVNIHIQSALEGTEIKFLNYKPIFYKEENI